MTEVASAAAGDTQVSTTGELLAMLETLDPADRAAVVDDFLFVLRRRAQAGLSRGSLTGRPVVLCGWAGDAGIDGELQRIEVDLRPGPTAVAKTRAATGRELLTNGFLGADTIHVPAGEGFAPHTHPGDHLLFVLGGRGTITAGGEIIETAPGQVYMVDGAVPHAVGAITDHVLLSVGSSHRPLESMQRQELVPFSAMLRPDGTISCLICDVSARTGADLEAAGCCHSPHRLIHA